MGATQTMPVVVNGNSAPKKPAEPTTAELLAKIAELEAKVAADQPKPRERGRISHHPKGVTYRGNKDGVSTDFEGKGNIQLSGFGRFPVSLYPKDLLTILDRGPEYRAYLEKHKAELSWEKE